MSHEPECPKSTQRQYSADNCPACDIIRAAYQRGREDAADEILKLHGINDVNCYEDYQCYAYQQAEKAARGGELE